MNRGIVREYCIEKALAWPTIKSEDARALQAYAMFLCSCCNVTEELYCMQELDMPTTIKALVSKLPFMIREQCRGKAHDIFKATNDRAHFLDVVAFLEKHGTIFSDPVFGDLEYVSQSTGGSKHLNRLKPQLKYKMKGSSFATTATSMEAVDEKPVTNIKKKESLCCLYCSRAHLLEKCQQFKNKKHREKIHFLKEKGVCFGYLCSGHTYKP